MTQIDDLKSQVGLLPKPYKKENLVPIRELLAQIVLDENNVETVYRLLDPIQSPHLSEMLIERWDGLPKNLRTHLVRLRRTGKDRDRVISGCVSLASGLAAKDTDACADLLAEAPSLAKGSDAAGKFLLSVVRRDWLSRPSPLPFEVLGWNQLGTNWRWQFLYALVNVVLGEGPKRTKLTDQGGMSLMKWLLELSKTPGLSAEDAGKIAALGRRLDPSRRPAEIDANEEPELVLAVPPNSIHPAPPPDAAVEVPIPTQRAADSPPNHVVSHPSQSTAPEAAEVSSAMERLFDVWRRFASTIGRSTQPNPTTNKIREMEEQLRDAGDDLNKEIANNQQLKRNLQAVTEEADRNKAEKLVLVQQLAETESKLAAIGHSMEVQKELLEAREKETQELRSVLAKQEEAQTRHLQAHLKEERRACRVELGQAIQNKVRQIQSLSEKPATAELVATYRAVVSGLLDGLQSQGINIER